MSLTFMSRQERPLSLDSQVSADQRSWLCLTAWNSVTGSSHKKSPPRPRASELEARVLFPLMSLWQSQLTLRRADHVLCLNEEDRTFLATRFKIDPERITECFLGRVLSFPVWRRDDATTASAIRCCFPAHGLTKGNSAGCRGILCSSR